MKKMVLGSAMIISGVIGFAIWQTSAASTVSAFGYSLMTAVGFLLAIGSLKDKN